MGKFIDKLIDKVFVGARSLKSLEMNMRAKKEEQRAKLNSLKKKKVERVTKG